MHAGILIQNWMERTGRVRRDLIEATSKSAQTWSQVMTGKRRPTLEIAAYLEQESGMELTATALYEAGLADDTKTTP